MTEMTVGGAGNQLTANALELAGTITESNNFRRAHECEVQRVEEQHHILSFVVRQRDGLELTINDGGARELGSWLLKSWERHFCTKNQNKIQNCSCTCFTIKKE